MAFPKSVLTYCSRHTASGKADGQAVSITSMRGEKRDEASELRKRELFDDVRQCEALTIKRSFSFSANEAS